MPQRPTHFRCQLHGVVLPWKRYQEHCDEEHNGTSIAVTPVAPPKQKSARPAEPDPPQQLRCKSCGGSGEWPTGVCEQCSGTGLSSSIRERIESGIQELHDAIIQYARDGVRLETKRMDRKASAEEISDASMAYRTSEKRVNKAVNEHKKLWMQLAEAGYATARWPRPTNGNRPSN